MPQAESYKPRTRLFVAAERLDAGAEVPLDAKQAHYLRAVLRLSPGARIALFNGRDGEWQARIDALEKRGGALEVEERLAPQEIVPDLWLCFAPIKKARLGFLIEKATELGVARLVPVFTERSVVDKLNYERLRAHIVEAAEQCGRTALPELDEARRFDQLLGDWPEDRRLMFCDEMREGEATFDALRRDEATNWAILTGPEGGFSAKERAVLGAHPAVLRVHLGPRILRADTAALAAVTLWQAARGDWR